MTHRHLSAFHPSGQSFAIVSHDHRLKVFSTVSQQLQHDWTEAQHLTHSITALACPHPNNATHAHTSQLIAIGTKAGDVLVWHSGKGEVVTRFGGSSSSSASSARSGERHQAPVASIVFHPSGQYLFSAAADGIKQWSLSGGSLVATFKGLDDGVSGGNVGGYSTLAVSNDGELLAAGGSGSLNVWHVSSPSAPLRDYQGPTARINALSFSPDSRFLISSSTNERHVAVWSAPAHSETAEVNGTISSSKKKHKKSKEKVTPVHTFTLQNAPIQLYFSPFAPKSTYHIAALSDSSLVSVLSWSPDTSASSTSASTSTPSSQCLISVPHATTQSEAARRRDAAHARNLTHSTGHKHQPKATASNSTLLAGDEGDTIGAGMIQAIHFMSNINLMVARGDAVRPQFDTVTYAHKDGSMVEEVTLAAFRKHHLLSASVAAGQADAASAKKRKAAGAHEPVTLGAQHTTDTVQTSKSALDGEANANKRAKLAHAKSRADVLSMSLAARLAASDELAASASAAAASFDLSSGSTPKASSLQTILQQALHSNDHALVEYCLTTGVSAGGAGGSASQLIRTTVQRLSHASILPILRHLQQKFTSRPHRSAALLPWLREIFKCHTSYLLRQPKLSHQLAPLYHLIDQRVSVFKKLLKLQGRMELILAQMTQTQHANDDVTQDHAGPLNTFNDGEEEEESDEEQGGEDEEEDDEEMDMEDDGEEDEDDENDEEEDSGEECQDDERDEDYDEQEDGDAADDDDEE